MTEHPKGIRFYRSSVQMDESGGMPMFIHDTIEESRSDFDLIFRCLYPSWSGKFILDAFRITDEEEWLELKREYGDSFVWGNDQTSLFTFRAEALDFRGRWMEEFEGNILLIYDQVPPETMTFRESWDFASGVPEGPRNRWRDGLHCVLHNWDGIYWEIFTVSEEERRILLQTHLPNPALHMFIVDFNNDFPHPREAELERATL